MCYVVSVEDPGTVLAGRSIAQQIIISQVADNTTLFLKDFTQILSAPDKIDEFPMGLWINKCELSAEKVSISQSITHLPVKVGVT